MKPLITVICSVVFALNFSARACDDHSQPAKMSSWHTRALKPYMAGVATNSLNADSVFQAFSDIFARHGAHIQEAYAALGLHEVKHYDIAGLYKTKTGKKFTQSVPISKCVKALEDIRSQQPYMSHCAEAFQNLRIQLYNSTKDSLTREALLTTIDFYEETGSFWDVAMHVYALGPKTDNALRRDNFDLENFSQYYMILRQLGLTHVAAHTIASLETAYATVLCDHCGVW